MSTDRISMEAFLRSGTLGAVHLGMTDRAVRRAWGEPDDWGPAPRRKHVAPIWKYGDIELHFDGWRHLDLVHFDHFSEISCGRIPLDPWIVSGAAALEEAEEALLARRIAYRSGPGEGLLVTTAGVELRFDMKEGGVLVSVSLARRTAAGRSDR